MRLQIRHDTTYEFHPPMRGVVQSLRLWPSRCEGQVIIDWTVTVDGATRGAAFRDGAGDKIETAVVLGPVESVVVSVAGTVETTDLAGVLRGHREKIKPAAYLRHTGYTKPDSAFRDLARSAVDGVTGDLDRARAEGHGVCQDHADALSAAAFSLDIPARYVTGYLHAEGGIAEASHAWAELHVPDLGWVGFDPSNGMCPNEHYVRLGSGFDALDAAPIRGVAQGMGTEALKVDVNVVEAAQ